MLSEVEFKDNTLTNKIVNGYDVNNTIEKIVILATDASKVMHEDESLNFESIEGNIIIKNPHLKVNEPWSLQLVQEQLIHDEL